MALLHLLPALLMPALPHLPLEGASGRLVPFQDLDGAALMIALLLLCLSALQFGLDPVLQLLQSSCVVAFSICVLVSILAA